MNKKKKLAMRSTFFCLALLLALLSVSAFVIDSLPMQGLGDLLHASSARDNYTNDAADSQCADTYDAESEAIVDDEVFDQHADQYNMDSMPPRPAVRVNCMSWAQGVDDDGEEILGWVCEDDLRLGRHDGMSIEEITENQNEWARRFYETGEYRFAVNLYSDQYATEIIGRFYVVSYSGGQPGGRGILYK